VQHQHKLKGSAENVISTAVERRRDLTMLNQTQKRVQEDVMKNITAFAMDSESGPPEIAQGLINVKFLLLLQLPKIEHASQQRKLCPIRERRRQ